MARGLDWDAAAKRDYIRDHGSIPYWVGLSKPKSRQTRPEQTQVGKTLAKKARARGPGVVAEFAKLSPEAKVASADQYCERIRRLCADERRSLRYVAAIAGAEKDLIGQIKGHSRRAQGSPKLPSTMGKPGKPPTLLGVTLDPKAKPGTTRQPSYPSPTRQTKKTAKTAETSTGSKPTRQSRFSGLLPIAVTSQIVDGRLVVAWEADERIDQWMLTLLRRRRSVRAVERVALPGATTSATSKAKMTDGPYSLRLFGIGSEGPLTRGALDGLGSRPKAVKRNPRAHTEVGQIAQRQAKEGRCQEGRCQERRRQEESWEERDEFLGDPECDA